MAKIKWEKILSESWLSQNNSLSEDEAKVKLIESEFEIRNARRERRAYRVTSCKRNRQRSKCWVLISYQV